jgi:biopolymer transport protein ExbD
MNLSKQYEDVKLELQVAPLIDVVFLLLIYFMVTAALIKKEADISFMLPAEAEPSKAFDMPVEALIEIDIDGTVQTEEIRFSPDDRELDGLVTQIAGLRRIAESQSAPFFVNILPHEDALHRRIIDVMDACAVAGVTNLMFNQSM